MQAPAGSAGAARPASEFDRLAAGSTLARAGATGRQVAPITGETDWGDSSETGLPSIESRRRACSNPRCIVTGAGSALLRLSLGLAPADRGALAGATLVVRSGGVERRLSRLLPPVPGDVPAAEGVVTLGSRRARRSRDGPKFVRRRRRVLLAVGTGR